MVNLSKNFNDRTHILHAILQFTFTLVTIRYRYRKVTIEIKMKASLI